MLKKDREARVLSTIFCFINHFYNLVVFHVYCVFFKLLFCFISNPTQNRKHNLNTCLCRRRPHLMRGSLILCARFFSATGWLSEILTLVVFYSLVNMSYFRREHTHIALNTARIFWIFLYAILIYKYNMLVYKTSSKIPSTMQHRCTVRVRDNFWCCRPTNGFWNAIRTSFYSINTIYVDVSCKLPKNARRTRAIAHEKSIGFLLTFCFVWV